MKKIISILTFLLLTCCIFGEDAFYFSHKQRGSEMRYAGGYTNHRIHYEVETRFYSKNKKLLRIIIKFCLLDMQQILKLLYQK